MPRRELAGAPSPARERMWRAIRMLRQFNMRELLEISGVERRKAAEKYVAALVRAEYLRIAQHARGCGGNVYMLIQNTGPFAPRVGAKGLSLDPNLEVARLRTLREKLTAQIAACDKRLIRLGAFVERQQLDGDGK
jgi:hypothetical protein